MFFGGRGGEVGRGKYALGRGLGPSPQESVSVPLSKHIHSSILLADNSLLYAIIFVLQLGKYLGGSLNVWGRSWRLNLACAAIDIRRCTIYKHSPYDDFIAACSLHNVLPLMSQIMCSAFWPNESIHSIEYGQLVVTFVNTTPKPDWEMTVLQVADQNRVSSSEVLYSM